MSKIHYITEKNFICNHYEIVLCGLNQYDVQFTSDNIDKVNCKNCLKTYRKQSENNKEVKNERWKT